jgi:ATP-dependent helicase/nuclease subunit A
MSRKVNWTDEQKLGITTTGKSLLVSAAAGSGKTAMLAERCAHLVCDAPEPCDVDDLLVVTFTEAAATAMKSRIHSALRDRARQSHSARVDRQLAVVNHASVGTLHSFCARLLREHFQLVGLDPAFTVLDGDEAGLLRREVARQLFDDHYEFDQSGDFHRFVDAYGEGEDSRLIRLVIQTHQMLESLVDPLGWIDHARHRITDASEGDLSGSELGAELRDILKRTIADLRHRCDRATELVKTLGEFPAYQATLFDCSRTLRHWEETLDSHGVDALGENVRTYEHPRLPQVSNSIPNKEQAKRAVDAVRDGMTKGLLANLLRFTSDQWQEGLAAVRPHAQTFLHLVEAFGGRYRQAKDASRVVDFADLERFAFKVLCDTSKLPRLVPSDAARGYHRRFAHVLVDEYQDINELQDAILTLLSRECLDPRPHRPHNFFCVGDVKQSIYRFRLAEAARFLDRQKLYRAKNSHGEVIDLQANFRSRAALLESINGVFERLMTADAADIEYDRTHRLHPGLAYPTPGSPCFDGAPLEMHVLPADLKSDDHDDATTTPEPPDEEELDRTEREATLVARRVRRLTGADGSPPMQVTELDASGAFVHRPVAPRDIVILLRSMRYKAEQFAQVLRRFNIPVHAQSGTGYFESAEIRDMLALLSILENQRQDIPLASVLRSPLAHFRQQDDGLARVRIAYPASPAEVAIPFHDAVVQYAREKEDDLSDDLRTFLATLERWRALAFSRPLAEVISRVFDETGYLAFCGGLHDGDQRVANLLDLRRRASQFGSFRKQGLSRFLGFLESLRDEVDLGQPSIASESSDVVRVMSIHRSKGLEFPVVVLPDLGKRINLSDCHGSIVADRQAGLGMAVVDEEKMIRYPSLASTLVQRRLRQQALAEELRVLYVAMTRAKEHLILVGTTDEKTADGWPQRWVDFAGPFPADDVLAAKTMLDWLGPVSAAAGPGIIRVHRHPASEVAAWHAEHRSRPHLSDAQRDLAALKPLPATPPDSDTARRVIDRLERKYPFDAFTRLQAAQSVTADPDHEMDLQAPRFLARSSPLDVGQVTHRVLLHLDFSRLCDRSDLDRQIHEMIDRKLLTQTESTLANRDNILWLLDTEIGHLLKSNAQTLQREVPLHFPAPAPSPESPSADPLDRIMIRGRIDLLIPTPHGPVLIDYKTDTLPPDSVPARAALYTPQLTAYRTALEKITHTPVPAYLVFLSPRVIHQL